MNQSSAYQPAARKLLLRRMILVLFACCLLFSLQLTQAADPRYRPISDAELERYAKQLDLSREQQFALEIIYADYLARFDQRHPFTVISFARRIEDRLWSYQPLTKREFDEANRQAASLMSGIHSTDATFFDELAAILTEEQSRSLPRLRRLRASQQYRACAIIRLNLPPFPLTEIVTRVQLPRDEAAIVEPILIEHETALLALYKTRYQRRSEFLKERYRLIAETDLLEPNIEDDLDDSPERPVDEESRLLMEQFVVDAAPIWNLHRAGYQRLLAVLPPESARQVREMCYSMTYRSARGMVTLPWEFHCRAVLEQNDLSDAERQAVERLLRDAGAAHDRMIEELADASYQHHLRGGQYTGRPDAHLDGSAAIRSRILDLHTQTTDRLRDLIGEDRFNETDARQKALYQQNLDRLMEPYQHMEIVPDAWRALEHDPSHCRPHFSPIDHTDLHAYARLLELDDEQCNEMAELHDAYMERFNERTANMVRNWRTRYERLADGGLNPLLAGEIATVYDGIPRIRAAVDRIDETLFNDMAARFAEEKDNLTAIAVVRLMRLRDLHRGYDSCFQRQMRNGSKIDLARLLALMPWAARADWPTILPILHEYQQAALPSVIEYRSAEFHGERALYEMMLAGWRKMMQGAATDDLEAFRKQFDDAASASQRQQHDHALAIVSANDAFLPRIIEHLPDDFAESFEEAYTAIAYANVFAYDMPMPRLLRAVQQLHDLTASQQRELDAIVIEYHDGYAQAMEQIFDVSRRAERTFSPDGSPQRDLFDEMQHVVEVRTRLQRSTIRKLHLILEQDQIDRIHDWPPLHVPWVYVNP